MIKEIYINGCNWTSVIDNFDIIDGEIECILKVPPEKVNDFEKNLREENILILSYKKRKEDRKVLKMLRFNADIEFLDSNLNSSYFTYYVNGDPTPLDVREEEHE